MFFEVHEITRNTRAMCLCCLHSARLTYAMGHGTTVHMWKSKGGSWSCLLCGLWSWLSNLALLFAVTPYKYIFVLFLLCELRLCVCSCVGLCLCCLTRSAYWLSYGRCDVVLVLWYVYMGVYVCVLVCVYVCVCVLRFPRSCRSSIVVYVACLRRVRRRPVKIVVETALLGSCNLRSKAQGLRIRRVFVETKGDWWKRSGRNTFTNLNLYGVDNAHYASRCNVVYVYVL